MKCERCGKEEAQFTGSQHSYPHPDDCENTSDNLPGGFGWLCEKCDVELWYEQCEQDDQADQDFFYRQPVGRLTPKGLDHEIAQLNL